jgi:type II secretory pathway component PulF
MALRLHYGTRGPEPGDPVHNFLKIGSWVLISLGLTPAIVGSLVTLFGIVVLGLAAATLVEVVTQHRAGQRRSICTLLALLMERQQRIEPALLLSGQTLRGRVGRAARRLFKALDAGIPLTQAIHDHWRALPREAESYVAAGETMRAESAALRELSQTDHSETTTIWRACIDRASYLTTIVVVMFGVLTFVMIKIIPAYRDIFEEFDVALPRVTELAVASSNLFVNYLFLPMVLAMLLFLLMMAVVGLSILFDLPIFRGSTDRLFWGRQTGDVLRILAVATEQRQPLPQVVSKVSQVYPSARVRRQLLIASNAVRSGTNWIDALAQSKIVGAAEGALLHAAQRAGNLSWSLREIAKRREKRAVYRLTAWLQLLYPIVILMLAAVVGFYVIALFIPIATLIQSLV